MEKVNFVLDLNNLDKELNELKLDFRHDNMDKVFMREKDDKVIIDLTLDEENNGFKDVYRFYGLKREDKIYVGRYEYIPSFPEFSVYDEFFSTGVELKFDDVTQKQTSDVKPAASMLEKDDIIARLTAVSEDLKTDAEQASNTACAEEWARDLEAVKKAIDIVRGTPSSISVETAVGTLVAKTSGDTHYPNISISMNDVILAVVECVNEDKQLKAEVYADGSSDEPTEIIDIELREPEFDYENDLTYDNLNYELLEKVAVSTVKDWLTNGLPTGAVALAGICPICEEYIEAGSDFCGNCLDGLNDKTMYPEASHCEERLSEYNEKCDVIVFYKKDYIKTHLRPADELKSDFLSVASWVGGSNC